MLLFLFFLIPRPPLRPVSFPYTTLFRSNSIRHARPLVVGLNCALGAKQLRPYVEELARIADAYVCAYPNAGLPNAFGEYDEAACETAELLRDFAASGFVHIVGEIGRAHV